MTYQRVVSKIAEWSVKNCEGLQLDEDQNAMGAPQLSGIGAPALMSDGMPPRGKNQTLMPLSCQSTMARTDRCDQPR